MSPRVGSLLLLLCLKSPEKYCVALDVDVVLIKTIMREPINAHPIRPTKPFKGNNHVLLIKL